MKISKSAPFIAFIILVSLALASCSGTPVAKPAAAAPNSVAQNSSTSPDEVQALQAGNNDPISDANISASNWVEEQPKLDEQGAVTIEIIPVKLNNPGSALDFEVRMNTHSVDLSMNLAELATLSTDTGKTVQATQWDALAGGHHVSGRLSFPSSLAGAPLLEGVKKLTLTLTNVDAPERVFVWEK